jgi:two-component system OmpR family sensor kinase
MAISTRARLTLYFTALFGAVVLALATGAYILVRNDAYSKLDSGLHVTIDATAMSADHEFDEQSTKPAGESDLQSVLRDMHDGSLPNTQILVREGSRQVAYKGERPQAMDLRAIQPAQLMNGTTLNGLRIARRELLVSKFRARYEIYAAKAIGPALSQLATVRRTLLVLVPLGLGLAALAGYFLAQKSLAPLKDLTRTVDAITSSDLSARVRPNNIADEIGRLGSRFNSLLDRLQDAFTIQRRFMADASHELRTPVTVALTAAQVTIRDPSRTPGDCEAALEIVEQQMLRLKRIVQDMLFLSQADASSLTLNCKEMYLDDAVAEASRAAKTLAHTKQQSLKLDTLPEARCLGDQDLLKQAILILLENSLKFTPARGTIDVSLKERGGYWICRVTDSGVGIPEGARSRIFERFFRAAQDSGGLKVPGAGLGLAIAKSIVESHAGKLNLVQSRPGLITFEIAIPVLEEGTNPNELHANSLQVRM